MGRQKGGLIIQKIKHVCNQKSGQTSAIVIYWLGFGCCMCTASACKLSLSAFVSLSFYSTPTFTLYTCIHLFCLCAAATPTCPAGDLICPNRNSMSFILKLIKLYNAKKKNAKNIFRSKFSSLFNFYNLVSGHNSWQFQLIYSGISYRWQDKLSSSNQWISKHHSCFKLRKSFCRVKRNHPNVVTVMQTKHVLVRVGPQ